MKKRLTALFCVLAFLLAATAALASSTPTVYLLAVNNKMADLPGGARPISVNGIIYVPYTTFDKSATGVDLEVYYGIDWSQGITLTLYSRDGMLIFRVGSGTCEDGQGNRMSFRAVLWNEIPYVPVAVCGFFGLNYTNMPTADRGTLIRITDSRANPMTDSFFLTSAADAMRWQYNKIVSSIQATPTPTPTATATPTPTPTPVATASPGVVTRENVTVYLAVEASASDRDLGQLFPGGIKALFLFTPDSLEDHAPQIRALVAGGHSIGLVVEGTLEEVQAQLERGNELLTHIARIRTRTVSAPAELTAELTEMGWTCWQSNTAGTTATVILANLELKRTVGYVTLPGDSATITQVLTRLRTDGYTIRQPLETEIG